MRLLKLIPTWIVILIAPMIANAQIAPGEDPVQLTEKIVRDMVPLNNSMQSTPVQNAQGVPAWMDAKLARIQAKAFSADTSGVLTEKDVTNTTITDGIKLTCIQNVGTATAAASNSTAKYGNAVQDQIVVIRGDLVNFCR